MLTLISDHFAENIYALLNYKYLMNYKYNDTKEKLF